MVEGAAHATEGGGRGRSGAGGGARWGNCEAERKRAGYTLGMANTGEQDRLTVEQVLARLAELEDPKILAVNQRHGDDHAVNLTKLRALAKEVSPDRELARELWKAASDQPASVSASVAAAARLLAILLSKPRDFTEDDLDNMLRVTPMPKVHAWLTAYIVQKGPHAEALRQRWLRDQDPVIESAGWELTASRIARPPRGIVSGADPEIDPDAFLATIESRMQQAPERLQWAMNHTLAEIGIAYAEHRERAISIGEELQVLADYPTPPGCTSPFAPLWIAEMVRRRGA